MLQALSLPGRTVPVRDMGRPWTRGGGESYNAAMINKKKAKKPAAGIGEKAAGGGPAQIGTAGGEPEDRVRLPAILGVRPGVYLAWIYSLVILGILFFALVYPGLSRPGSIAVLRSEPAGAAVRVDGVYRGTAPRDVFVLRGKRVFEFVLPGFTSLTVEAEIPGRVFASVFVPHRQLVRGTLEAADPLEPLVRGAAEFAEWSLAGEPTAVYQIPLPLSEGAYRGGPAARDPAVRDAMNGVLDAALRFTVTRAGLRDFLRAKFLVDNGGLSPSPVSALASARGLVVRLAETPGAAAALAGYLPPEAASALKGSAWYAKALPDVIPQDRGTVSSRNIEVGGISFVETAGGSFVTGGAFPRRVSIEDFYLAAETVPPSSWEAFLAANPRWGLQHAAVLREQGLVTEDYLVPFSEGPPDAGISAVSWYAAEAYGEWLTAFLPPALSSYEVRLPTEAEWEYAIGLHGGIRNPAGSLWEWCKDLYAPLDMLPAPEEAAARVGSPERSLRGGSWINQAGSGDITARASLPPRFCSPFVSFRPVIALKKGASYE